MPKFEPRPTPPGVVTKSIRRRTPARGAMLYVGLLVMVFQGLTPGVCDVSTRWLVDVALSPNSAVTEPLSPPLDDLGEDYADGVYAPPRALSSELRNRLHFFRCEAVLSGSTAQPATLPHDPSTVPLTRSTSCCATLYDVCRLTC